MACTALSLLSYGQDIEFAHGTSAVLGEPVVDAVLMELVQAAHGAHVLLDLVRREADAAHLAACCCGVKSVLLHVRAAVAATAAAVVVYVVTQTEACAYSSALRVALTAAAVVGWATGGIELGHQSILLEIVRGERAQWQLVDFPRRQTCGSTRVCMYVYEYERW